MCFGNFSWKIVLIFIVIIVECDSLSFTSRNDYNTSLQVLTTHGMVQGIERRTIKKTLYFAYEGIPYARPPINNLRFRNPKSAKPWNGVLNATKMGPGCIELRTRFIGIEMPGLEDCLFLNVYSPKNMKLSGGDPLPVNVWIYGGGFAEGEAGIYGPDLLLDINTVVVTFNYRIGALGFLSTQDEASPGNYGLKDQNLALKWINENIANFGGDATKLVISGHSAGASSVMHHMLSPKSRGLFTRAVAWSGETTAPWSNQKNPRNIALGMATSLGINTENTTKMMENLRRVPIEDIKNAQLTVFIASSANILQDGLPFTPFVEPDHPEAFITEDSFTLLKRGDVAKVPLIIGTTTMEFGLFSKLLDLLHPLMLVFDMSPSSIPNGLKTDSFLDNRLIGKKIIQKYFDSKSFSGSTLKETTELFTDMFYVVPITRTIRSISSLVPVYFFVSAHPENMTKQLLEYLRYPIVTELKGVVHGEDIPLIWNYNHYGTPPGSFFIQKKFLKMWKNFATTGNPTPTFDPTIGTMWRPVADNKNISYLLIQDDIKLFYNYKKDIIDFWDRLSNEYIKK